MDLEIMKIFFLGNILGMLNLFSFQLSTGMFDEDIKNLKKAFKERKKKNG